MQSSKTYTLIFILYIKLTYLYYFIYLISLLLLNVKKLEKCMELKIKENFNSFINESICGETKKACNTVLKAGKDSLAKVNQKYEGWCEKSAIKCAAAINRLCGRKLNLEMTEKVAKTALKVLPIALIFLAMTPLLSFTSLVLVGAVSTAAVLLDPKVLPLVGKVKILQGAALGIALQTTLSVLRALVTLSPITAVGALLVGGAAARLAIYASKAINA